MKKRIKQTIVFLFATIFLLSIVISIIMIVKWFSEKNKINTQVSSIKEKVLINKEEYNYSELLKINKDAVGWIKINNTNVDYPVVKTKDNSFYLNHSFNKEYNSAGWIYMDYRNNLIDDKNTIIYGHNRLDGIMFGSLKKTLDSDWYNDKNNLNIVLFKKDNKEVYRVFSIYKVKEEMYYLKTNFTSHNYLKFLNTLKSRSVIDFNENLTVEDRILTLSTCSGFDSNRLVIHAKKIK